MDSDQRTVLVRFNLLSVQTTPLAMRSSPRFDYQVKHLQQARYVSIYQGQVISVSGVFRRGIMV